MNNVTEVYTIDSDIFS